MVSPTNNPDPLDSKTLQELRVVTDKVAAFLQSQVRLALDALRPAFAPFRLLGRYIDHSGNQVVPGADRAWTALVASYRKAASSIPGLPQGLDPPLAPVDPGLEIYPWEYTLRPSGGSPGDSVTVTCPTKWVLSFPSGFTLTQFRQAVQAGSGPLPPQVPVFVIRALLTGLMVRSIPGIEDLFSSLRLTLRDDDAPDCKNLSFVTVTSSVRSRLPAESVVLSTTRLTGVPRFTELIDPESIQSFPDPIRDRLVELSAGA